jgi:hypothetical protein
MKYTGSARHQRSRTLDTCPGSPPHLRRRNRDPCPRSARQRSRREEDASSIPRICNGATTEEEGEGSGIYNPRRLVVKKEI